MIYEFPSQIPYQTRYRWAQKNKKVQEQEPNDREIEPEIDNFINESYREPDSSSAMHMDSDQGLDESSVSVDKDDCEFVYCTENGMFLDDQGEEIFDHNDSDEEEFDEALDTATCKTIDKDNFYEHVDSDSEELEALLSFSDFLPVGSQNFFNDLDDFTDIFSRVLLYKGSQVSVIEAIYDLGKMYFHNRPTQAVLEVFLSLLYKFLPPDNAIPRTKYQFFKYFYDLAPEIKEKKTSLLPF